MWKEFNRYTQLPCLGNMPKSDEFYNLFKNQAAPQVASFFDVNYENEAIEFLNTYDKGKHSVLFCNEFELDIFNANITIEEVAYAIDNLKNGKASGIDAISNEILKYSKDIMTPHIVNTLNYIIENRTYPDAWAYGLKSPVPKPGNPKDVDNYRGITILPIMTKIFEFIVNNRLTFVNEAFGRIDEYNGGFLKGSRTSDNIFILKSLIDRQLYLGKKLYVVFVDFSKAFDFINRNILFYKIVKSGITGRIIDTVRDMYRKTKCKVKTTDGLSPEINNFFGVNQGGTLSPLLFRKYLADMSDYLHRTEGIVINEHKIISHILWADDLILFSDSPKGLQLQMDGLFNFCKNNQMIVNEMKTKSMIFGAHEKINIIYNNKSIEQVCKYKYLGIIFNSITRTNGDLFKDHREYIRGKANKAIYILLNKLKSLGNVNPSLSIYFFDCFIKPILTYGADIWGYNKHVNTTIEKIHLRFLKYILGLRQNCSTVMVLGDTGRYPLHTFTHLQVIRNFQRLASMNDEKLISIVFNHLRSLTNCGATSWHSNVSLLFNKYNFKEDTIYPYNILKHNIINYAKDEWVSKINDLENNPGLRLYNTFKQILEPEPYLLINNFRLRKTIARFRMSNHLLAIEKGRHRGIPIHDRICNFCNKSAIENEQHFLLECRFYDLERNDFLYKLEIPITRTFDTETLFLSLLSSKDRKTLQHLGHFICNCFKKRNAVNK